MSTGLKAFIGAFIGGMGSGITGYMMSPHKDEDIVPLLWAALAGGLITGGAYLKGLYTQAPAEPWSGVDRRNGKE